MRFSKSNIIKATVIAVVQMAILIFLFMYCHHYVKQVIFENHEKTAAYLNPMVNDMHLTGVDWQTVNKSKPEHVTAGIYLDRIQDFDIVNSRWSYEFYAWFKWNPKRLQFIDLKDSNKGAITLENAPIKIVNGAIERIETNTFYLSSRGDSAYILFHITGTTTSFFDVSQYPLDNYLLMIQLEDVEKDIPKLAFIADSANSNVSSRVSVNGFEKGKFSILSKPHTIKSSLGDPRKSSNQVNTYSQLRFALSINRGGLAIYLKIFVTLYIAALLGFLSFFAAPHNKIEVIVGSLFFAAVTLNIIMSRIPSTHGISIAEIVNDLSLVTILMIAASQTLIKFILKNNKELDLLNTWITFIVTLVFYISINIEIPFICIRS
jgi:hypothetical protein